MFVFIFSVDLGLWDRWLWANAERTHWFSARRCIWSLRKMAW